MVGVDVMFGEPYSGFVASAHEIVVAKVVEIASFDSHFVTSFV
jgi:hypothetical protein